MPRVRTQVILNLIEVLNDIAKHFRTNLIYVMLPISADPSPVINVSRSRVARLPRDQFCGRIVDDSISNCVYRDDLRQHKFQVFLSIFRHFHVVMHDCADVINHCAGTRSRQDCSRYVIAQPCVVGQDSIQLGLGIRPSHYKFAKRGSVFQVFLNNRSFGLSSRCHNSEIQRQLHPVPRHIVRGNLARQLGR